MPRYDRIYESVAERAIAQGVVDIESFFSLLINAGVPEGRILELMIDDAETNGPVFGKFLRGIKAAAGSAAMAAVRQGEMVGYVERNERLSRLVRVAGDEQSLVDAIDNADPEAAEVIEAYADEESFTWVAELINTCHRCLPLHGTTLTMREWRERGLLPDTIHSGWDSDCHCRLVPKRLAEGREDLVAPLKRVKLKDQPGVKGSRTTARQVSQADLDSAIAARDKAMDDPRGRKTLRLLGQAGDQDGGDDET